jgi:hypothetical protein
MVLYPCNPRLERLRQEDGKYKASLSYIVRPCFKNNKTKQNESINKQQQNTQMISFQKHTHFKTKQHRKAEKQEMGRKKSC